MRRLKGNYGFKRFLRDGAHHLLEDPTKRFYSPSEVKNFDGVENEYPIYFAYMVINCIFAGNIGDAKTYYSLVKSLMQMTPNGQCVIPYYYYVEREFIELEREKLDSQRRLPSDEIENESFHLWTQAIWIICELLGTSSTQNVLQAFSHALLN